MNQYTIKKIFPLVVLFLLLFILFWQFPYLNDDWRLGTESGLHQLSIGFKDYDGRYIPNYLTTALLQSNIFCKLFMSFFLIVLIFFAVKLASNQNYPEVKVFSIQHLSLFTLAAFVFISCPKERFRQTIAWTSGFLVYVVASFFLLLGYYLLEQNGFGIRNPANQKKTQILYFIIPFLLSVCVENITIGNLLFILLVIVIALMKKQKINSNLWRYLAGSIFGTFTMFSHPAYRSLFSGQDDLGYRAVSIQSFSNIATKAINNYFDVISNDLCSTNLILNMTSVCFLILLIKKANSNHLAHSKHQKLIQFSAIAFCISFIFYSFLSDLYPQWQVIYHFTKYFEGFLVPVYYLSFIACLLSYFRGQTRTTDSIIYIYLLIICISVPLLPAYPLSGRIFFPMYTLQLIICLICAKEVFANISINDQQMGLLILVSLFIVRYGFLLSIYSVIHHYDIERIKFINNKIEKGEDSIPIPELPYLEYLSHSTPYDHFMDVAYLQFYGLDEGVDLKPISLDEWLGNIQK